MLINVIGFNLCWFGLVIWENSFIPVALIMLIAHIVSVNHRQHELLLILITSSIGICVDSVFQYLGFFIFSETQHIPFWLMTLWACFAATLGHSLSFLDSSYVLQSTVGAVFAPLSYIGGFKLNVVDFAQSILITYITLSTVWACLFLVFFFIKSRVYGIR
ncbi:DUF2878 domain-containing protein [Thalassotalea atypica]|uniref:DUF2878 domain-containing protein n=1 Tax=Thalassotalea atypica TaxID=2054316 RepID=UPI0025732BF1|nr:DUF2878 domain-containing protein [Thalassotalea atypica]